jgi:hypothetical protein
VLKHSRSKVLVLIGVVVLVGGSFVAVAAASGHYFHFFHQHGAPPPIEITRTISISASGGTGPSMSNLSFTNLLPGAEQIVTVDFHNTGNTDEDVYVVFPNETALSALNSLGQYGAVHLSSAGAGSVGDVFDSTNLNDNHGICGTFSPSGCWPLGNQYEIARSVAPTSGGSFSFGFEFATAYSTQAAAGTTDHWNPYPVHGQTTVVGADGSGAGLPYELVAMQPGITPGQKGKIFQVYPYGATVTAIKSGSSFSDQLAVDGANGPATYVVTSANKFLKVSGTGLVTTVGGPLPVGSYTVSGTVSDTLGDYGTWTNTLVVSKGIIICSGLSGKGVTGPNSGKGFGGQISVTGAWGSPSFFVNSSNIHLKVSSSGQVTTVGGPLAPGTYSISGTDVDGLGDAGTWTYTVTVSK